MGNWIKRETLIRVVTKISFQINKLNLGSQLGNLTFLSIPQTFEIITKGFPTVNPVPFQGR